MKVEQTIKLEAMFGTRSHEVEIQDIEVIPLGSELKFRVKALFLGKDISMVLRHVDEHYIEIWKKMRKAGLPVANLLRKTDYLSDQADSGKYSVVITDFSHGGAKVYGKDLYWMLQGGEFYDYSYDAVDDAFWKIIESEFEAITSEVMRLTEVASDTGIVLPEDHEAFELRVKPDKSWEIVMIDIQLARMKREDESDQEVREFNKKLSEDFLFFLKETQKNIWLIREDGHGYDDGW